MLTGMSLKYRIALIIFLLEGLMMGIVLWQTLGQSFQASSQQLNRNEEAILQLVKGIAMPALITEEYVDLQPYIEDLLDTTAMTTLYLTDERGVVVVSSVGSDIGRTLPSLAAREQHQWRTTTIERGTAKMGELSVEFSTLELTNAYYEARNFGISLALSGMLIIAIVGIAVGMLLTRRLEHITDTAKRVAEGDYSLRTGLNDKDELGRLAMSFDNMVQHLVDSKDELDQTLAKLQEREQNLAITLQSIGDAVIVTDACGVITLMNPTAEKITGWPETEAKGRNLTSIFPIVDAETGKRLDETLSSVLDAGEIVYLSNNATLLDREGVEHQIMDSAAPIRNQNDEIIGMVLVFNDVTEQYRLRQELAKSQRDLQAIMDHTPSVVYIKDLQGRYQFINAQYLNIFGLTREQVIGKTDIDLLPFDVAKKVRDNDAYVLKSGFPLEVEEDIPQTDGIVHVYISEKFPLLDEQGSAYALCGISTDITERKRHEEEMKRAQKMDSLGKVTGGVAHDFNNILNIILGYAALLDMKVDPSDNTFRDLIGNIQKAGERGANLTQRLLSFSRKRSAETQLTDVNKLIHNDREMLQKILTARIALDLDLQRGLWLCELDASELEDALINLVLNAMHAIGEKGRVSITSENVHFEEAGSEKAAGDFVKLTIKDDGCGMSKQTLEHIFEPFFSTKGKQGTGLGLSQVYGFVQRSNGQLNVHSTLGQGSCFELYFPRASDTDHVPKSNGELDDATLLGNERIVVVDDEKELTNLAQQTLSQYGYDVIAFNRAQDVLQFLTENKADAILSDIIMPDMDGYELAAEIMRLYPHIKIQLVSGYSDDRHMNRTQEQLKNNILYKPYTIKQLLRSIREMLD